MLHITKTNNPASLVHYALRHKIIPLNACITLYYFFAVSREQ